MTIKDGKTLTFDFVNEDAEFSIVGMGSMILGVEYNQLTNEFVAGTVDVVGEGSIPGNLVGIGKHGSGTRYAIWTYSDSSISYSPEIALDNVNLSLTDFTDGIKADNGTVSIKNADEIKMTKMETAGIYSKNQAVVHIENVDEIYFSDMGWGVYSTDSSQLDVSGKELLIEDVDYGIRANSSTSTVINVDDINVFGAMHAVSMSGNAILKIGDAREVSLASGTNEDADNGYSIHLDGESSVEMGLGKGASESIPKVNLKGAVFVEGDGTNLTINAGELSAVSSTFSDDRNESVISTDIYAISTVLNGFVKVTSPSIDISTHIDGESNEGATKERAVWAESGTIDLSNSVLSISTEGGQTLVDNNTGAALVAGASYVDETLEEGQTAAVGTINATGLKAGTRIRGDMVAGINGVLNVELLEGNGTLNSRAADGDADIQGNALAANGGELNLKLGKGAIWSGRADDYQDADKPDWNHNTVFAPEFSRDITSSGIVNVELNDGAYWNVTGQSWVTELSGNGGKVNLVHPQDNVHAVHVNTIKGEHTFVVSLNDADHAESDMLYIENVGEGAGRQFVEIADIEGLQTLEDQDRIRFATVNASAQELAFVSSTDAAAEGSRTVVRDKGFFDMGFRIESEDRAGEASEGYNGEENLSKTKPGDAWVDAHYDEPDAQNWYLVRDSSGDRISETGQSVIATARATYWNAIEIDRLNKRLGDARHANGGTEGLWVRIRHDRIGTDAGDGDFRSRNLTYQVGYDHLRQESDGRRLFGIAFDYMDGDVDYRSAGGEGGIDRFGVTAYTTWFADNGAYVDLVAKWGVLSNSINVLDEAGGVVRGDYDNHVLGASVEVGHKLMKADSPWFLEPQAQLQVMMVTDASYTTSQGTRVEQDQINSAISRFGFRVGRTLSDDLDSIAYFKSDWLHEWHGHQRIEVTDVTTGANGFNASIDNQGDWFNVGGGVQAHLGDEAYLFADVEYAFGNDLDKTWSFNTGFRWQFY